MFNLEELIDLRECISRRLKEVISAKVHGAEAIEEQRRRAESLKRSLDKVESEIKDQQFEFETNPLPY